MGTKKIILIVAAVAIIGFFVFFMRKKSGSNTANNANSSGDDKLKMATNMANNAVDAIKEVVLSEEDEEYNLLRQEYIDRFGASPKSNWSKAMIQQQIDSYERKSALLDQLVDVTGQEISEEVESMSEAEILRVIQTEKVKAANKEAQRLEEAKQYYYAQTGKNQISSALNTPEAIYEEVTRENANAREEYKDFYGVYPSNSALSSAIAIRQNLNVTKNSLRSAWNKRKQEVELLANRLATDSADPYKNYQDMGDILGYEVQFPDRFSNRDVVYFWDIYLAAGGTYEVVSMLAGGKGYWAHYSNVKNSCDHALSRIKNLYYTNHEYRSTDIDEYGRCMGKKGTTLESTDFDS